MENKLVLDKNIESLTNDILELKTKTIENMIEIGKKLIEVKEKLPHGQFGKYLKENVDFTQSCANKYMRIVNEFLNCESITILEPTKQILLLDVPKDHLDNFTKENNLKDMSCRQIREKIKELKKDVKKPKKEKKEDSQTKIPSNEKESNSNNKTNEEDLKGKYSYFDDAYEFYKNDKKQKGNQVVVYVNEQEKETLKKFYKIIAKTIHPDKGGNQEEMQILNKMKEMWGI